MDNTQEIIQSYEADIRDESSAGDSDLDIRNDGDGALSIVVGTYPPPADSQPPIQSSSYHVGTWDDTTAPASWIDVGSAAEPLHSQDEANLRARSPETLSAAHILAGSYSGFTYPAPFSLGQAVSQTSPLPEPLFTIPNRERAVLISAFLQESGTWCETTDSKMHFTVQSVHKMMENKAYQAAALALSSRQLDEVNRKKTQLTLELYQHTIQLLLHQDPVEAGESILATCTLLCVYEMMASGVSEWRRHLRVGAMTPPIITQPGY